MKESAVKDRIVAVASRLFYQQGYNLTGINQIIDEAEIARASLYNHFDSKTALLLAYLERAERNWFAQLEAFLAPIADPKQKLLALFDQRVKRQQESGFGGCQFIKISAEVSRDETDVLELVKAQKQRFKDFIGQLVQQVDHSAVLTDEQLTDLIFLLLEGGAVNGSIAKNSSSLHNGKTIVEKFL
ncbi:TetR/AcrR family transcriptional regulator [Larkinella terrae]|uniref:TetR family transcriptional regulator n=1 Tax=Larkinella terrae TaxID=2025311 RepID=A0A7K0ENS1_9BACT|nr:TetR/AcrR family transcriptional regulator [Larkinella terrae]MRS63201.1 TetR family transcriptional regulator [Larkinella terrae]